MCLGPGEESVVVHFHSITCESYGHQIREMNVFFARLMFSSDKTRRKRKGPHTNKSNMSYPLGSGGEVCVPGKQDYKDIEY